MYVVHINHVCERVCVCVFAGCRISAVRNRKLALPFGCGPNWLCAVDRMLTEHIAQTGPLFLSVFHLLGLWKYFLRGIPCFTEKNRKETQVAPSDKLRSLLFFQYLDREKKGNVQTGDTPALMSLLPGAYRASAVYCSVSCLASECVRGQTHALTLAHFFWISGAGHTNIYLDSFHV